MIQFNEWLSQQKGLKKPKPSAPKKATFAKSPGAQKKYHPKLASRYMLELTSEVLGIDEGAIRARLYRRGLGVNAQTLAKLIREQIRG